MAKPSFNAQNPVRHEELEQVLKVFAQKLLDELHDRAFKFRDVKLRVESIARETINEVYRR